MSDGTGIQWTEATWNPVVGCTRVSAGCDRCYAVRMSHRLERMGQAKYAGLTVLNNRGERHFNGTVRCDEDSLTIPMKWRKPRRIFVNSMSDLFHKDVPFEFIDRVFAVMALCPQHTFQVLTKRPERMAEYLDGGSLKLADWIAHVPADQQHKARSKWRAPLPNVWLGASCEDQPTADARIPDLLRIPAKVWFLSCEPLLGEIDLAEYLPWGPNDDAAKIDWVIVGCESRHGKRIGRVDGYEENALSLIRQCRAAGVACFHKQMPVGGRVSGDPSERPEEFRVREMPRTEARDGS